VARELGRSCCETYRSRTSKPLSCEGNAGEIRRQVYSFLHTGAMRVHQRAPQAINAMMGLHAKVEVSGVVVGEVRARIRRMRSSGE
jgi:hypothetical protein